MPKKQSKPLPSPGQIFAALRAAVAEPILLARKYYPDSEGTSELWENLHDDGVRGALADHLEERGDSLHHALRAPREDPEDSAPSRLLTLRTNHPQLRSISIGQYDHDPENFAVALEPRDLGPHLSRVHVSHVTREQAQKIIKEHHMFDRRSRSPGVMGNRVLGQDEQGLRRVVGKKTVLARLDLSFEPPEVTPENTWRKDSGGHWYPFKVKGQRYTIKVHSPDKPGKSSIHLFKFEDQDGSMDVTGAGNANHVFAHVIHAFKDFAQNHATLPIGFDAEGSESRVKLYRRLAEKLPKHVPGYEVETLQDNGGDKASWLARKKRVDLSRDTEAALWSQAATDPDARGVLADYLEERGDPLHKFLRVAENTGHPVGATAMGRKHPHVGMFKPRATPSLSVMRLKGAKTYLKGAISAEDAKEIHEYLDGVSPVTSESR